MKKLLVIALAALWSSAALAQTVLQHYQPGFRTINGSQLNLMVDQVNSLSGGGGGGPLIGTTLTLSGNIAVNTNKFTVTASSGNTLIAGTLNVTGATVLGSTLTGGATSDIAINTNKFTVAASSGNTLVAGTLGVTGVSTFTGQIVTATGTPTIASGACGTTTNGVITSGTNQAGLITIGAAATTTCTVSFSATLGTAPNACLAFPASAGGAATGTTVARVSSVTTSQFVITGSALASTAYYYICL